MVKISTMNIRESYITIYEYVVSNSVTLVYK
jgi:hypothetical protein